METIPKAEVLARLYAVIAQVRSAPAMCGSTLVSDLVAIEQAVGAYEAEVAKITDAFMAKDIGFKNDVRRAEQIRNSPPPVYYQTSLSGKWRWSQRRAS